MTEIADVLLAPIPVPERYNVLERCMERENRYLAENECKIGYPKVKETLEELAKSHRLFIVSNSQCGYPELCMDKLGISHLFEGHMCFGDTGTCKGETIRTLMKKHNIGAACYIGDTMGDMEAADLAELPFIHCTFGFGEVSHCWKAIDNFEDLVTL
jgi:phosphoglycolate phosphatase